MSDRIAIMNHGKLQQFDTPDEVYYQPANIFVAGFIGSPALNFIDGELIHEDGALMFARGAIRYPIPPRLVQRLGGRDGAVTLGARPESIGISHSNGSDAVGGKKGIPGSVFVDEPLGSDKFVTVEVEKSHVIVRTNPEFRTDFGEAVQLHFNPDKVYLFDKKTGDAIY